MDKSTLLKCHGYLKPIEDIKYINDLKKLLSQKEYEEFYEVIAQGNAGTGSTDWGHGDCPPKH